ncbi:hypothetical protein [Zoogloea sp.]|uniref:hypothetical protein n=1 Tax=Zoogloea sp. TaxID=49181 RepID=UPI001ACA239E|nr:hypothetical protein [Zoogloea sp.]MBN8285472.1 hypothetical protein [Zoogloea sp.]
MTTSITRRLRLVGSEEARAKGKAEAQKLLAEALLAVEDRTPADAIYTALIEFIALAHDNRHEECNERLKGFCEIMGPALYRTQALEAKCALLSASPNQTDRVPQASIDEQHAVHAAIATCSQVSAGRIIAANPNDDDAIVTLCELQMAVRALEPKFTETEGGEL